MKRNERNMRKRVVVVDISEFPEGRGLEKPLRPKRQRSWQSRNSARQPPLLQPKLEPLQQPKLEQLLQPKLEQQSQPTPLTLSPAKLSPSPAKLSPSPAKLSPSPAPHSPSPAPHSPSPAPPSPSPASPSPSPAPPSPSPASPYQYMPPSPAMFVECENASVPPSPQHQTPPSGRRSLQDTDTSCLVNCGSDDDSEDDDDENAPVFIPRVYQSLLDTPLDEHPALATATTVPTEDLESPDTSLTLQPKNLFDFDWRDFPSTPIPPESRREKFSKIKVGPTTPCVDPFEIFTQIWDRQIMEHIVKETNKYAQEVVTQMMENNTLHPNSRLCSWRDTDVEELYVYFGLILAMGVVVKSRIEEYWVTTPDIFYTPGYSAHMSIDRFLLLSRCIHFNDNRVMSAQSLDYAESKLFKIKPILLHLNKKFQEMYIPSRNLALDESLLQWKGWLEFSQQIPNKVAHRGVKSFEICESQTGYLWRFEVHVPRRQSSQRAIDPLQAFIPSIVLQLVQGLEHKGYTLWMDNYYNSPCLARRLKCLGFDCVGTLRTDRQSVPPALNQLTKYNMRMGEITGVTSGDVDVMVWRDNSRVAMISTYHGNTQQTVRGTTKPTLILDYNIMMGGVDKKDQLLAMYPIERKRTKVWYKKFFKRLLNVSVLNSYIIHRHSSSSPFTHRNFRQKLIRSLLSFKTSKENSLNLKPIFEKKVDVSHRLAQYPMGNRQRMRRVCTACKHKVQTFCVGCNRAVCMEPCFLTIHS